jgi:hypothetical protein
VGDLDLSVSGVDESEKSGVKLKPPDTHFDDDCVDKWMSLL